MAVRDEVNAMILLDTCVLLWLSSDQESLSSKAMSCIERHAGSLFVSAITAFEIAIKCRSGKLELPLPPLDWYLEALRFHGLREIPVTGEIAALSVSLPPLHNDPCDRIIIASATATGMKILTSDRLISQYREAETVW